LHQSVDITGRSETQSADGLFDLVPHDLHQALAVAPTRGHQVFRER